jgi:hypothetical protein
VKHGSQRLDYFVRHILSIILKKNQVLAAGSKVGIDPALIGMGKVQGFLHQKLSLHVYF